MTRFLTRPSEWLMIAAGILLLVSVPLIAASEIFTVWFVAKTLYGAGVIVMIIELTYAHV